LPARVTASGGVGFRVRLSELGGKPACEAVLAQHAGGLDLAAE